MSTILSQAQTLVMTLIHLMPSQYQQRSLQALLGLFLDANGISVPAQAKTVSPSAISRFLNQYDWSTRHVIRAVRSVIVDQIIATNSMGRRPVLQVVLDLTTLEKVGKFKELGKLIRLYNGKRGVHLLVLYILIGHQRVPWGFRVYGGKGETSPVELAQRLLKSLPKTLTDHFELRVLADSAFGSIEMLKWIQKRPRTSGIFGIRCSSRLKDGRRVTQIPKRGQQVCLHGLERPVTLSWYWLKKEDGTREKRFVISTKPLSGVYITILGRRRWQIEGFFKIAKHRFCLHRFGQGTLKGVYRWLVLSLIAYFLAHLACLWSGCTLVPDWGEMSRRAMESLLPTLTVLLLVIEIKRLRFLAQSIGLDISVTGWQYG